MTEVLEDTLLCHAVEELLDDSPGENVLPQLARILEERNLIDSRIAQLIGRDQHPHIPLGGC